MRLACMIRHGAPPVISLSHYIGQSGASGRAEANEICRPGSLPPGSAAELVGEFDEALGHHVEIMLGRDVARLHRAVLEGGRLTKAVRLTASVPMGTLLSEVDDTSILRKGPTARHHCSLKCSPRSQKSRPPQRLSRSDLMVCWACSAAWR
jgi:hypothetical protein